MSRPRVLFLCTHNSTRSQMAEGFLRALAGDRFEPGSAGTEKTAVWSFPDPSRATGSEEERLAVFRGVRDQIHERLTDWLRGR
ncbi:MAG TPA: hypothetical protein VLK28_08805 [Methylomirabilota bacterium]|nr:hypothetical protein [Methylomirabilota bacterium]